jgi:hypothetical protein
MVAIRRESPPWLEPLGYAGGTDLYAYCGNNPVTLVDPGGEAPSLNDMMTISKLAVAIAQGITGVTGAYLATYQTQATQAVQETREIMTEPAPQSREEGYTESQKARTELLEDTEAEQADISAEAAELGEAGTGTAEVTGGAATIGAATIGAAPILIIAAGAAAIADLGAYITTGQAKGPFTKFGTWLGDRFFPGPGGGFGPGGGSGFGGGPGSDGLPSSNSQQCSH